MKSLKDRWKDSNDDIEVVETDFKPSFKPSGKPVTTEELEEFKRMIEAQDEKYKKED